MPLKVRRIWHFLADQYIKDVKKNLKIVRLPKDRQNTFCKWFVNDTNTTWLLYIHVSTTWSTNIYFSHMFTRLGWGVRTHHTHPYPHRHRVPTPMWNRHFWNSVGFTHVSLKQWQIQEVQNQGRGAGAVGFLRSWDCFDPFTNTKCFCK